MQIGAVDKRGLAPIAIQLCVTLCLGWLKFPGKAAEGKRLMCYRDELLDLRINILLPTQFPGNGNSLPSLRVVQGHWSEGVVTSALRRKKCLNFPSVSFPFQISFATEVVFYSQLSASSFLIDGPSLITASSLAFTTQTQTQTHNRTHNVSPLLPWIDLFIYQIASVFLETHAVSLSRRALK